MSNDNYSEDRIMALSIVSFSSSDVDLMVVNQKLLHSGYPEVQPSKYEGLLAKGNTCR